MPLIYFHIVEWHFVDRVLYQFGIHQPILETCDTDARLHRYDLRGRAKQDWADVHWHYVHLWGSHQDYIVDGYIVNGIMDYSDSYI